MKHLRNWKRKLHCPDQDMNWHPQLMRLVRFHLSYWEWRTSRSVQSCHLMNLPLLHNMSLIARLTWLSPLPHDHHVAIVHLARTKLRFKLKNERKRFKCRSAWPWLDEFALVRKITDCISFFCSFLVCSKLGKFELVCCFPFKLSSEHGWLPCHTQSTYAASVAQ